MATKPPQFYSTSPARKRSHIFDYPLNSGLTDIGYLKGPDVISNIARLGSPERSRNKELLGRKKKKKGKLRGKKRSSSAVKRIEVKLLNFFDSLLFLPLARLSCCSEIPGWRRKMKKKRQRGTAGEKGEEQA